MLVYIGITSERRKRDVLLLRSQVQDSRALLNLLRNKVDSTVCGQWHCVWGVLVCVGVFYSFNPASGVFSFRSGANVTPILTETLECVRMTKLQQLSSSLDCCSVWRRFSFTQHSLNNPELCWVSVETRPLASLSRGTGHQSSTWVSPTELHETVVGEPLTIQGVWGDLPKGHNVA